MARTADMMKTAERIHGSEVSERQHIEGLNGRISKCESTLRSLSEKVSALQSSISSELSRPTTRDSEGHTHGGPDYSAVQSMRSSLRAIEDQIEAQENARNELRHELHQAQETLQNIEREKGAALVEIQQQASTASASMSAAGGMYGAYAGVGATLQSSFSTALSNLSQAASILGGSIGVGTSGGGGHGHGGGGMGSQSGGATTGTGGFNNATAFQASPRGGGSARSYSASARGGIGTAGQARNFTSSAPVVKSGMDSFATSQVSDDNSINHLCGNYGSDEHEKQAKNIISNLKASVNSIVENPNSPNSFEGLQGRVDENGIIKGQNYDRYREFEENMDCYDSYKPDQSEILWINPNKIEGIMLGREELADKNSFYSQHCPGGTEDSFISKYTQHLGELQRRLKQGESLESLMQDDRIGECARLYCGQQEVVAVIDLGNGCYVFEGNGRHRILSAAKLGVDVPVRVVRVYTQNEEKVRLNQHLDRVPEHKQTIKNIISNAPEPHKSVYMKTVGQYNFGNTGGLTNGAYYSPDKNNININMHEEPNNPRGPYTTFFHESAHAIDFNLGKNGIPYSLSYRNQAGESLQDMIYKDVRNDISASVRKYVTEEESVTRITNYIMSPQKTTKYKESLLPIEQLVLENVQQNYHISLTGPQNEAASDIYGGVTNNFTLGDRGAYGHTGDNYWYTASGQPTGAQSTELFAEYFSYAMSGDEGAMRSLRERFPSASRFLDEMVASM